MNGKSKPADRRLAFLATYSPSKNVYLGGLLVTNALGRPLEFQCTAPIEPNRTQVLLYGPTLEPYVVTELIGRTLLDRVGVKPHLVLVENESLLSLRTLVSAAVGCVVEQSLPNSVSVGRQQVTWSPDFAADKEVIRECCEQIPKDADLAEPFERVVAALKETTNPSLATGGNRGAA